MPMNDIIHDATDWNPQRSVNQGAGQTTAMQSQMADQQAQAQHQRQQARTDGGQRATVGGEAIRIPKKRLEFWLQVGQLAVLILIMLRQ